MGRMVYIRNKKTTAQERGTWPEKKRLEVLTTYLSTGNRKLTSAMTGVPDHTIYRWTKEEWWREHTEIIRNEESTQLDAKLSKILDKSLDAVMDRIENGELMYDPRTGDLRRVPPRLRDVQKVTTDLIDKKQLLQKRNEVKKEKEQVTGDHLVKLAEAFAAFANANKKPDVELKTVYEGEHTEVFEAMDLEEVPKT